MSNRTTINVDKDSHEAAGDVKDEHGETWPEVLQWYAEHRGQNGDTDTDSMQVVPVEDVTGVLNDFSDMPGQEAVDLEKVLGGIPEYDVQKQLDRIEGALGDSRNLVQLEATEYRKIADEVEGRLR